VSACVPSLSPQAVSVLAHRLSGLGERIHPAVPVLVMVAGFAAWWPIGLAVLALWKGGAFARSRGGFASPGQPAAVTGNTAFDAHRATVLQRLEAERRALDDQQREFADFLGQLKRARDREEFDRFLQGRDPAAT
jgi:hypothetical protein